jgi:predicted alpha/beta-hydrolase family hydrolase
VRSPGAGAIANSIVTLAARSLEVPVAGHGAVSALLLAPSDAVAAFVFAHGAGAGMRHAFMEALAQALAARRVATLRFNFPSMEQGGGRPDPPAVARSTVRAAVEAAARHCDGLPLFAGGKSFGGRMTSQAQAESPLASVRGLAFVGFPLHPAGRAGTARADHLSQVRVPMLFLQGTRDALADAELMRAVAGRLGERATLRWFDDADHAFHVRARSGTTDEAVQEALAGALAEWMTRVAA